MARRRFQNGCVFKRGKAWVLRYREDVRNQDGSLGRLQRSVVLGQFRGKKEAKAQATALLRNLNNGARRPQSTMSLVEFWDVYCVPDLALRKLATRRMVGCLATKHVLPALGKRKLCDLSRADFQDFINLKHREGYSSQTIAHLRNVLSRICATAMMRELLAENLARGLILPRKERRRPFGPGCSSRVLTVREVADLSGRLDEQLRLILMFGVLTGLRIGEILALCLEDFDLEGGFFTVRRNVYQGHVQGATKTNKGRQIPIAGLLISAIGIWLKARPEGSHWLFPSEAGTPFHDRNLLCRKVWPVCDRAGIVRFGWHTLRHTFSTFGGNSGVPLPVMQSLLGHTSAETTMLYTHPLAGPQREAVEKLAGILFPNVPIQGDSYLAKVG